jgi:hypothetical protein
MNLTSAGSEADCARRRGDFDHRSACLAVRTKTQKYHCGPAAQVWTRVRAGGAVAWVGTKSRSEISGSRETGLKSSTSAILIRWNTSAFPNDEAVQSRFVDSPKGAVAEGDDLVSSVMKARGYPVSDFDQSAADISVDHPRVVENYRSAHEIALRVGKDQARTEELRTAMIHYRSLFEELVQVPVAVERKEVS